MKAKILIVAILGLVVIASAGCGHKNDEGAPAAPPSPTTIIQGLASKGPISEGIVKVYAIRSGGTDTSLPIGVGLTDATGNYTIDVGAYKGPVMVEVSGGAFTDEVSGSRVTVKKPMRTMVSNVLTGANTAAITPLTELASGKALGGGALTAQAIDDANQKVSAIFKVSNIVTTLPDANATDEGKKYAAACGAVSQLANDGKRADENLDDALARIMDELETEMEQDGGLSVDSLARMNDSISKFNTSGKTPDGATASVAVPAGGRLKIGTSGATSIIGAIDMTVTLPEGTMVAADPETGEAMGGTVRISGQAASGANTLTAAKVTPASGTTPGQVAISLINAEGFGTGECVSIDFTIAAGAAFPANAAAFSVTGFSAKGADGLPLSGVTAAPTALSGL